MSHNITVQGGTSVRLPTAGKYCDRDILITAEGGGIDTSDATALPPDIFNGKTAYVNGEKVTGTMPEIGQMIEVLTRTTPDVSIPRGYHDGTGLVYIDLESKMVTPSNVGQTVEPSDGKVLSAVRVNGDANLVPTNIAEGVTIFGVTGTHSGGGIDTSDATANAWDILEGKTAYVNGEKVSGAMRYCESPMKALTIDDPEAYISQGYHDGMGAVWINPESKTVTPSASAQTVSPSSGRVLSSVMVNGDANLVPANIAEGVTIFGVTGTHSGGGGGGDSAALARSIIDKSITSYSDSTVTTVGGYSFVDCDQMTSVSVPSATTLGNYAFSSCGVLSSVNIPSVTTLGQYAFNACTALETISGGEVTATGNYSFTGCTALSSVNFPKLVTIAQYTFQNCTALTEFDGEEVTTIATYAFTGCSALTSFNLPKAKSVGAYAFNGAGASHISLPSMTSMSSGAFRGSRFVSVDLPNVTNVANNAFRAQGYIKRVTFPKATSTSSEAMRNCSALEYVDFPVLTSFGTYTFQDCTKLETLILRTTSKVVPLGNANILGNTAIAAGNGHVYLPGSMVSGYQTAANWNTIHSINPYTFRALEDYTVDGTITGALDESKI